MKKAFITSLSAVFFALTINTQAALSGHHSESGQANLNDQVVKDKLYDEDLNPIVQINEAIAKAQSERKFVICQVGGNWCPWCLRFADFITNDTTISRIIDESFVYIHVNYNPRKSEGAEKTALTQAMLKRLNNPERFGFPVLVVLDEKGKVIHIQDSSYLEGNDPETDEHLGEGNQVLGYNQEKVLRFFKNWTPKAVKQ